MKRFATVLLGCLLSALAIPAHGAVPRPNDAKPAFARDVLPLVTRYCTRCHGGSRPKAGLALDRYRDDNAARQDRTLWEKVAANLRSGAMPPPGRKRPGAAEVEALNRWLEAVVFRAGCTGPKDPGQVTLRRLNRAEYNNTIRDLVGVHFRPADDFPSDDVGYGFDNIGDVLSLPPLLMEKYLAAADQVVDQAFRSPEARRRILIRAPNDPGAARAILQAFASRAYRRPVREEELTRLLRLVDEARRNGDDVETGIRTALVAVLVSPHFLFRVEVDPRPKRSAPAVHLVNDYELASRLSYFLWSSMPDDELLRLAREKTLRRPGVLEPLVRRMLRDSRSRALVDNFAGQWLQTRKLRTFTPDPVLFPNFDEPLRAAMIKETELFFESVMHEDRSVLEFLDSDYTFVNERLARHYGIPGVKGDSFRRVSLAGTPRGGLLTQAGILAVTSNPTRTSPVKRGKWILENILNDPPPPPPPGVSELKEGREVVLAGTLRQRMEQHRADPACSTCHQRMDSLGFGFENFDAIGAWRTHEGRQTIDPSGILPDGRSFKGPAELRKVLRSQQEAFGRCLTEKLLTYALGRGLEPSDRCVVDQINRNLTKDGYRFSRLILEIVKSDPFQKRRGQRGG